MRNTRKQKLKENKKHPYKQNRKILLTLILGVFLIGIMSSFVSAGLLQNNLQYHKINKLTNQAKAYGQYSLHKNGFLGLTRGKQIQTFTLLDSENSIINAWAKLQITNYKPESLLDSLKFKGGNIRDLKLSYLVNESYQVPTYKQVCSRQRVKVNQTNSTSQLKRFKFQNRQNYKFENVCKQVKNGTITKQRQVWKPYNKQILPAGTYKLKIEGKLPKVNHAVDWILNKNGESLEKWMWWDSSWGYKKQITITETSGTTLTDYSKLIYVPYNSHMNSDYSDLRFTNSAEDTELGYWIENYTSSGAYVWVKIPSLPASSTTNIYMYYGNSGATTTSNKLNALKLQLNDNFSSVTDWTVQGGTWSNTGGVYRGTGDGDFTVITKYNAKTFDCRIGYLEVNHQLIATGNSFSGFSSSYTIAQNQIVKGQQIVNDGTDRYDAIAGNGTSLNSSGINTPVGNNNIFENFSFTSSKVKGKTASSSEISSTNYYDGQCYLFLQERGDWGNGADGQFSNLKVYGNIYLPSKPTYTIGAEQIQAELSVSLTSPADNTNFTTNNINFVANVTPTELGITNVSLVINGNITDTNSSGAIGTYTFPKTLTDGNYNWTVIAYGNDSKKYTTSTRNLFIDATPPVINITSPSGTYDYLYQDYNLTLNFTTSDNFGLSQVWYNYNGTNTTLSVTNGTLKTVYFDYEPNKNNLTVYANDTLGNINSSTITWTSKVLENSRKLNSSTYETATESYKISVSSDSKLTKVYLNYSNTSIPMTYSNGEWVYSRDVPIGTGNNSINYIFTYDGTNISSTYSYQNVLETTFTLCNSTYTQKALNLNFKDETDLNYINATIPLSTWTYYLGSGKVNKIYTYSSTTLHNNYTFCSTTNRNLNVLPYVQYKQGANYPQRIWEPSIKQYNQTMVEQTLYLLNSINGIYVTYQVLDSTGSQISGVDVTVKRTINGKAFIVGKGQTDSAGGITFWLNPDFVNTITFSKEGYTTYTLNQFPTQSTYTVTLTQSESKSNKDYLKGISYSIRPLGGTLEANTNYYFNFSLNSSYWNVSSFGFNLLGDGTVMGGNSSNKINTTTFNLINVSKYSLINMSYYWIINGTRTTETVEWNIFNSKNGSRWSIMNFFTDLKNYTNEGIFGLNTNTLNLLVFLFIFISVGLFSYKFGVSNPAIVSGVVFILVLLFDYGLGMINASMFGVKHFPTLFIGLITLGFIIRRNTQ